MEKNNQNKPNPLEHLSDEEILQLLNAGAYSANVRWEAIRRKITNGEYDPAQSGKDSLYMLNRLAFFSELNKKETLSQEAQELIGGSEHSDQLAVAKSGIEKPVVAESEETTVKSEPVLENIEVAPAKESPTEQKTEKASVQKPETVRLPHDNFSASPFLKWIKGMDPDESTVQTEIPTEEIEELTYDLSEEEKSEKNKKDKKKSAKNKKSKKPKNKDKKTKVSKSDLSLNPEIVSETLADLLADQGHIEEANEMYRQLGVKYPKKSSYFASKLKKS